LKNYLVDLQNEHVMKKRIKVFLLLGGLLMLVGWGCSLVGYGFGADADSKKTQQVKGWEVFEISAGRKVAVHLKDKTTLKGHFVEGIKMFPNTDTAYSAIVIKSGVGRKKEVPLEKIEYIQVTTNEGKIAGAIVGLGVDVMVGAVALKVVKKSIDRSIDKSLSSLTSCPIIYSYDGLDSRPDAEMFAGAIFQAAERPDWDNLDFLREDEDGVCRLKMANEFDETQQVDFVKLLAIDHPKGSRVLPSFSGKMFTVDDLQIARVARDYAGTDIRSRIRKTDEAFWLSNPFGRDLQNPDALRDGLILEFDRSVGTSAAALVLNVQNTPWASDVQRKLLELPGRELPQWYDNLNNSPRAREDLVNAMVREGMLKVHVWDDKENMWRYVGHVWSVGSALPKDIVVELDLLGTHNNKLKIKLDCPPGMWMVNSVGVDYSYHNIPNNATEIAARKAVDQAGHDVLPQLARADNQYHSMPTTRDVVDLEFVAPARKAGMERSYMFNSGGFYTIHMPAEGEPKPELMQQMMRESGAFTRFALESLYWETGRALEGRQALR
jgi:hypothetical protein